MGIRNLIAGASLLALAGAVAGFTPTAEPVSGGTRAVVDLPAGRHIKNVGGSDGAGLCVFTSAQHAADWQNVRDLDGFREWMRRKPGGGWPQKFDKMVAEFCKEKGVPVPLYVQHTGGDDGFLDVAIKTDRMPCVTYAGRDDYYSGRIAHMVNLAHLDSQRAAIIDNNRPGVWLWMTRAEFLTRWRDMQGGWAVVFMAAPPPPHPDGVQAAGLAPCICGGSCKCGPGKCPGGCPVVFGQNCPGGKCPNVSGPAPVVRPTNPLTAAPLPAAEPKPIGNPPGPDYRWENLPGIGWGWVQHKGEPAPAPAKPAPAPVGDRREEIPNHGVDSAKIHDAPAYSIAGVGVERDVALASLVASGAVPDDSDRWHLTAVGDAAFLRSFKADVDALPADVRGKLLVQAYGPDHWAVNLFRLPAGGVVLRKPSPGRISATVGTILTAEYSTAALLALLSSPGGPVKVPAPMPAPNVEPAKPAPNVEPKPDPKPEPKPEPPSPVGGALLLLIAAGVAWFLSRRK